MMRPGTFTAEPPRARTSRLRTWFLHLKVIALLPPRKSQGEVCTASGKEGDGTRGAPWNAPGRHLVTPILKFPHGSRAVFGPSIRPMRTRGARSSLTFLPAVRLTSYWARKLKCAARTPIVRVKRQSALAGDLLFPTPTALRPTRPAVGVALLSKAVLGSFSTLLT